MRLLELSSHREEAQRCHTEGIITQHVPFVKNQQGCPPPRPPLLTSWQKILIEKASAKHTVADYFSQDLWLNAEEQWSTRGLMYVSSRPVSEVKYTITQRGVQGDTAVTEARLSAPACLHCGKAPFNWTSVLSVVRMERSREEGTECEWARMPLLLFRWPVDGDGVQCFMKWPPADKHVPFPAQLPASDIEPDKGINFPPIHAFLSDLTIKKNQYEE